MPEAATDLIDALTAGFAGEVIGPQSPDYDATRSIFNSMIDRRPELIARVDGSNDIKAALSLAAEAGLEVAVRGGGHSVAGSSAVDGGLVIDMRRMNSVSVDPAARLATVSGGASWSDVDRACQPHGLATTGGRVSTTGVAGLTLGGGSGWLERKMGLACDNLASVTLVTAGGDEITASEDENQELFWALHGGGGNFGVVSSLRLRLQPLPEFAMALLLWPASRGPEVVTRYREFAEQAPPEVGGGVLFLTGPPEDFVPAELQGSLACACLVTFAGTEAGLREQASPMLELGPQGEMIAEIPYADMQCMLDDPPGFRNYWSAEHLAELPDAAVDAFCSRAAEIIVPSPTQHIIFPWGGAVAAGGGGTPVANRAAAWVVHPLAMWEDPAHDQHAIEWTRAVCADVRGWAAGGAYLNFTGDEGEDRVVEGYGGREVYDRLARVKAEYDPGNVFHLNHNIKPLVAA